LPPGGTAATPHSKETPVTLNEGDFAPAFEAKTDAGKTLSLAELKGKSVVLYFYPKDDTPGCTIEACAFRDNRTAYEKKNAVILGVSLDGADSHRAFKTKFGLPFTLLVDEGGNISRAFGVFNEGKGRAARWTFVIGSDGRLKKIFPNVSVEGHAAEVLSAL